MVPSNYNPSTPLALTFAYHGAGGTEADSVGYGIQNAPGASAASIFVFPQGIDFQNYGVGWDDTCGGYDMPFFDHMVAALESSYCIDKGRIFAAGFSWGCDHVTALTCCRGNVVRAVGAHACTDEFNGTPSPQTYANMGPNGCPYENTTAARFSHDSVGDGAYTLQEFQATSALYRLLDSCGSSSTAVSIPTSHCASGNTTCSCVSYQSCTNPVVECFFPTLGHTTPPNWGLDTWSFFSTF